MKEETERIKEMWRKVVMKVKAFPLNSPMTQMSC